MIVMKKTAVLVLAGIFVILSSHISREIMFAGAELKSFSKPDEVREFPKGRLELLSINGATIGKAIFQPGWKWSESVQPLVKTKTCEAPHFQYHLSGTLMVQMDDGTLLECKPGDVSLLPSGHDAWVVGNEPVVVIDFHGMIDYGKSK
jgi:hypothetical protein